MENGFIPTKLKRINDEIVAVSCNGKVSFFDEKLNINKKKSFKFYAGNSEMLLNDIKFDDSNMYVLIKGFDMQKENVLGEITSYDLKSGKKVNTTPLKAKKEWEIARLNYCIMNKIRRISHLGSCIFNTTCTADCIIYLRDNRILYFQKSMGNNFSYICSLFSFYAN
ncbi:hypothetical protein [Bacillus inaquosorum]|uniref:hypothetical protein n=1 Tax=Bacillus inaquosorum TaxID=483913 RepID=UPI00220B1F7D|nr:hypothetical protein [Bacillus inaquosorum]MCY9105378.1 hypothetical protein [Bacillus inaquosorum]UTX03881.1 hypothetical protein NM058_11565 [Bacillus inaquosorum]